MQKMAEGNYNKDEISTFIALPVVMCENNPTLPEQLAFKNVLIQKLDDGSICLIDATNLNISKLTLDNSSLLSTTVSQDQAVEQPSIKSEQLAQNQKPIYQCLKCPKSFQNVHEFRKHISSHRVTKKYTCDKCSLGYNEEVNYKIHMALHFEGKPSCPICNISFQRLASLKSHLMLHQVEELYSCQECFAEFEKEEELDKHFQSHWKESSKDTLVCGYCLLELKDKAEYKEHVSSHVQMKKSVLSGKKTRKTNSGREWTHSCTECDKKFSKASLLERHLRVHSGERPFVCEYCSKGFNQKGTLRIHLNKHLGLKPYECTLCSAKFNQKGNLRVHVEKTHTAPTPGVKTFKCSLCTCIFKKIASLNVHTTKFHSHKDPTEDITSVLTQLKELDKQIKSGKTNELQKFEKEQVEQNRKVLDELTDQNTATPDVTYVKLAESFLDGTVRRYIVKRKIVNEVKFYICNYCKKEFKKPSDLIRHTRVHTREKPFQCNKCGTSFSLKCTLLTHTKAHHSGANTFTCYLCFKKFNYPRSLKLHLKKHLYGKLKTVRPPKAAAQNDEQVKITLSQPLVETDNGLMSVVNSKAESQEKGQYQCQVCKSCYLKPRNLRRHMLTHNREKRFKCDQCPKSYFTRQQLMIHSSSHTGIKNYACPICKKKYVTSSTLTRHMITHNSDKPYVCPYCRKNFKSVNMCRKHINIHKKDLLRLVEETDWGCADASNKGIQNIPKKLPETLINPVEMLNSSGDGDNQKQPTEKPTLPEKEPIIIQSNVTINQIDNIPQISVPEVSPNQIELLQQIATNSIQLITSKDDQNSVQTIYVNCQDLQLNPDNSGALCNNNLYPQDEKIQNTDTLLFNSLKEFQEGNVFSIDPLPDFEPPISQTTEPYSNNQIFNVNQIINSETTILPDLSPGKLLSANSTTRKSNDKKDGSAISPVDISINDGILTSNIPYYPTPDVNLFFNIDTDLDPLPNDLPTTFPVENEISLDGGSETVPEKTEELNRPIIRVVKSKKFSCLHCKRTFDMKNSWKKHVASHNKKPSKGPTHTCMFCQKMFKKQSDLTRHIRTHTGERPFACDKCDRKFTLKSTLVSHERTHDPVSHKNYNCIVCNSSFTSKCGLRVHMNIHTGAKPHACSFCPQRFTTAAHKRSHESLAHNASKKKSHNKKVTDMLSSIAMDVVSSQPETNTPQNIDITSEDLENVLVVQQQLQLPSESDNLNLLNEPAIPNTLTDTIQFDPVILQQLQSTHFLFQDQLISPQSVIQLDDGTLLNIKSISSDLVAPVDNLMEPEVKVVAKKPEKERNHECDICHKKYASKDVLRKHKKIHGLNKKFPCSKCDKGFDTEDALTEHGKVHLGYQFPCMYCANSFTHQQSLTTHMKRIHNISSTPLRDNLFLYTLKE